MSATPNTSVVLKWEGPYAFSQLKDVPTFRGVYLWTLERGKLCTVNYVGKGDGAGGVRARLEQQQEDSLYDWIKDGEWKSDQIVDPDDFLNNLIRRVVVPQPTKGAIDSGET